MKESLLFCWPGSFSTWPTRSLPATMDSGRRWSVCGKRPATAIQSRLSSQRFSIISRRMDAFWFSRRIMRLSASGISTKFPHRRCGENWRIRLPPAWNYLCPPPGVCVTARPEVYQAGKVSIYTFLLIKLENAIKLLPYSEGLLCKWLFHGWVFMIYWALLCNHKQNLKSQNIIVQDLFRYYP